MKFHEITSSQNPKIKQLQRLKNHRERDQTSLFLIEGFRELIRAQKAKVQFEALFICPELFLGDQELNLIQEINTAVYQLPTHLFEKISYRDRPDGLIGIANQMHLTFNDLVSQKDDPPFYLVAEAIEKPGNLGTILRSADAAGVDGVIICDRCTDIYNPNVVRASVGTLFTIPVVEATSQEAFEWLRGQNVQIIATTPSATLDYTQAALNQALAIIVGTEQIGLSSFWLKNADCCVKIPMAGCADSLNVATATTILLYETVRQRKPNL